MPAVPYPAPEPAPESPDPPAVGDTPLRGLLVDWGGVLTAPLDEAMAAWAGREGVPVDAFGEVMKAWHHPARAATAGPSPVHELERGRLTPQDFEVELARALKEQGAQVEATGLLARVLEDLKDLEEDMLALIRRARRRGLRTALLSNSWGEHYPEHLWVGAFDAVVISGRVGMRKPDAEIFRHAAALLHLEPAQCVLVDDIRRNIDGAVAVGMVGVLHRSYAQTAEELAALFDVEEF